MDYFKGNKNIVVDHSEKSIEFQPYNTEITLPYLKYWLEKLPRHLPFDYSVKFCGFNFDGLHETNLMLLCEGGQIICNYTGNYRSIFNRSKLGLTQ